MELEEQPLLGEAAERGSLGSIWGLFAALPSPRLGTHEPHTAPHPALHSSMKTHRAPPPLGFI